MRERTKKSALSIFDTDYILDKALVEILSLKNYENVLDFGAGSSPYRSYIKHTNYTTADVAQNKNFKIDVIIEPNKKIPLNDDSYDLILLTDVIAHVPDYRNTLDECYRLLKKGGELIISTPFIYRENETPNDIIRFTSFGLKNALAASNYESITVNKVGNFAFTMYCNINEKHIFNGEQIKVGFLFKYFRKIFNIIMLPILNKTIFDKAPSSNASFYHHLISRAVK
jgi:SAM-dependent methyltransferase